ncbi:mercuric reductase [Chitinophaga pinensis]|uniref:Pyridine nucleotide-disulphide oxidoreductase dimerisation region n=1 Tax=Chitinophaga pinensis (strain ATCC 43595 / DSM 2588 / LMG 13176 / NBRC 15968 / NCIMB 11800 / UQM 2034) TaxID=485918 RepID=A0A979G7K8_CHIPD|nr:mercuric reductase [Chitinophaga pinensis]ACU62394.1 pyridine nucleotide-disulphide oxidoreductase dimerisation region [Chitinophaga pinensis DSM 2588]
MRKFDAIVIGSGQGGVPLAKKLAKAGWQTAIVEKRWIGGTCINDGCTPTKSMIACGAAAHVIANSQEWGITVSDFKVDLEKIVQRKNKVVESFRGGATKGMEKTEGLSIIYGEAVFTGEKTLNVILKDGGEEAITAPHIFINTGTLPKIPPVPGLDTIKYLTNTSIMELTKLPSHLVIMGSGYIGLEFGQLFRRLGSQVTIIDRGKQLLKHEDEDVAAAVKKVMETSGVTMHTGANVQKVEQIGDTIRLQFTANGENLTITGSHLLVAIGRTPQSTSLQPEKAGLALDDKGYFKVNDQLETNVSGIYVLGDVKGGPEFTHISYNDYLVLYKRLVNKEDTSIKDRPVPYCMFTDPQLGRIGLTEKAAKEAGYDVKVACLDMTRVARAIETGNTQGFMKAVINANDDKLLGVAILGPEGGEVMSVMQMAMLGGITAKQLREMIFAHPLYSESINNLFMTLEK